MMKRMKKAISFVMAVCMLAGSGYVGEASTSVSVTPIVQTEQAVAETSAVENSRSSIFDNLLHPLRTLQNLKYNNVRTASAAEKEEEGEYRYVLRITGDILENSSSVPARMNVGGSDTVFLDYLKVGTDDVAGSMAGVKSRFEVGEESKDILAVDDKNETDNFFTVIAKKPGWANLHGEIWKTDENNKIIPESVVNFYVTFLVTAELDRTNTDVWKIVDKEKDEFLILDPTDKVTLPDGKYQLVFEGITDPENISNSIEFSKPSPDVVTLTDDGLISIVGAGMTTITIKNFADITVDGETNRVNAGDPYEVNIIVLPTGEQENVPMTDYKKTVPVDVKGEPGQTGSEFVLQTNALDAANTLIWEIYAVKQNGTKTLILPEDNTLLSYSFEGSKIRFANVKAGTYQVKAYVTKDYTSPFITCLTFDIIVRLNLMSTEVYVNVGDYYDIVANSNIPEGMFDKLFSVIPNPQSEAYAKTDRQTGLVTALAFGTQKVEIAYNAKDDPDGIYSKAEAEKLETEKITYTIQIIDTLSISPSSAIMYTGGEMTLKANTTQHGTIYWEVSEVDQKYITVSANGVVTAHSRTPDNYEATVVAYQIIGGVTKRAECKIQVYETAATIELAPPEVEIVVGETKTIEAILTPNNLNRLNLRWQSMNEEIFTIGSEIGDTSIQIVGKAPGTATLIAINEDNGEMGYCKVVVKAAVGGIKLSDERITGLEKETYQLEAIITPEDATNKELFWWSVDPKIATVNQNGKVTFKKEGTTVICVRSVDNPELQANCTVVVSKMLSGINVLEDTDIEMYVGETHTIAYKIVPENASNKRVSWESFNTKVVTVDGDGKLKAKSPGTAMVMVMSQADPSIYVMFNITVKQKATSVKMNYTAITMNVGEYFDMEVTIAPATSTEASLIWESLSPDIATVASNGRITAREAGTALVLVRTESGVTSYCTVTVLEPVISLELDPTDIVIEVGEIFAIEPIFKPAEPSNMDVKWTSFNTDVAKVNAMGEVEGISRGSTIVTCESVDGGFRSFCLVTVIDPDIIITLTPDNYRLGYGKSYTLQATVTNRGKVVNDMELIWESSDEDICSVDQNGKIYGEDFGDATITVMLEDEEYDVSATCEVRVVREVTSIRLNHTVLTIIQGHTAALEADVQPSNATYTDVTFSSEDEKIAAVDEEGVITALKVGSTWIWAKAKDNSGKYARCWVTVIEPVPATGVTVSDKKVVLLAGEKKQLTFTIKPTKSTDDIYWTSGEDAIATVDSKGLITAHRTGTTTVTAMTTSGKTAQVEVIVLGLSRTTLEIPVYTQYSRLTVEGATGTVRWDVENTTICEVNNGIITARKAGTTYVSATVNGRTLRCKVTVTPNKKKNK